MKKIRRGLILKAVADHLGMRHQISVNKYVVDLTPGMIDVQRKNNPDIKRSLNEDVHHMESHAREHTPVDDYFAAGKAPILDLQAEHDPVAPRRFSGVLKSMVGDRVTIVVIPNASHALFPEQPEAVAKAIADFARRVNGT